jgi:hypothetical protein
MKLVLDYGNNRHRDPLPDAATRWRFAVKNKKDPKVTRPNIKVLMEGTDFERCSKHGTSYPKGGTCPRCAAEKKDK